MFHRKPIEERIAERQAKLPPLKEGKHFDNGPGKFLFISLITIVVLVHFGGLALVMHFYS